jgi:hypothetical protein
MCLGEEGGAMIEIDGLRRHVYIDIRGAVKMQELLTSTKGRGNSVTRTVKSPRYELKQWNLT